MSAPFFMYLFQLNHLSCPNRRNKKTNRISYLTKISHDVT